MTVNVFLMCKKTLNTPYHEYNKTQHAGIKIVPLSPVLLFKPFNVQKEVPSGLAMFKNNSFSLGMLLCTCLGAGNASTIPHCLCLSFWFSGSLSMYHPSSRSPHTISFILLSEILRNTSRPVPKSESTINSQKP